MRGFRERTTVDAALAILEARTHRLDAERVPVAAVARRVAAADIVAAVSVPHFTRAAMDGYAVVGESTFGATNYAPVELVVIGEARPGRPHEGPLATGEAVRITTGAPVPAGADAVVMAERTEEITQGGVTRVRITEPVAPEKHVSHVGEDVAVGTTVVSHGRRLRPQDLGVLASVGVAHVAVVRRPTVDVLVTGDELLPPGSVPTGAHIVDANSLVLSALTERDGAGATRIVYVPDSRDAVRDALLATRADVVLVSGGSSVGPEDHAPIVLAEIGELTVHGIAMRPSSPAGFGFFKPDASGRERPVFLLPGNPVSCLCAYDFFAGPTLRALGGRSRVWPHARRRAPLAAKIVSELGRVDYVRVRFEEGRVIPIMTSGASILSSTTRADGIVLVAADREGYAESEPVDVILYDE
jgi:molybdopterin molybdotransferase